VPQLLDLDPGDVVAREYSTETLRQKLYEEAQPFFLIDTLPAGSYQHRHLPGALSLPLEDLEAHAEALLPDLDAEIITYCSGPL
jgi:rhodanese-related sulfurtransferase